MQHNNLRTLLQNSTILKISSCIVGFALWTILQESYKAHLTLSAPICFYNTTAEQQISAPDTIAITLRGSPAAIRKVNTETVALHVNADMLHAGENTVVATHDNLLLPADVSLLHYKPTQTKVKITE